MAIFHLSAKVFSRSNGFSVTAGAAYRAGEKMHCVRTGRWHNYTKKREVVHREITAPENAPDWAMSRSELWNNVEQSENRKDAQLAREIEVSLPIELSIDEQIALASEFVATQFVSMGMVADWCIHAKPKNPHCHILLTLRDIGPEGFSNKQRGWNSPALIEQWRSAWEELTNQALQKNGLDERIDHRSLKAQGISKIPTLHIGKDNGTNTEARNTRIEYNQYATAQRELSRIKNEEREIHARIEALTSQIIDLETTLAEALTERDTGTATNLEVTGEPAKLILPGDAEFSATNDITPRRPMQARQKRKSTTTTEDTTCSIYLFPS